MDKFEDFKTRASIELLVLVVWYVMLPCIGAYLFLRCSGYWD